MVARVAHELRRRVEAHRLTVQERAREDRRIVALQPRRDVGQLREAGGVALRKAVLAESLDLAEAALGEVAGVAAADHAVDELVTEAVDRARIAEAGHGPPQLVGFGWREPRRDDGDPHDLFLEQWHAQRLPQHLAQLFGRVLDRLASLPPAQVGVDHVALDRSRAHDRHLDDQVVEGGRLQPGQHRHLGAAFDLENPDGVATLDHPVRGRVLLRHALQRVAKAVLLLEQGEGLADAREHPEPEHVDLDQTQSLQVVLVPFDHRPVRHGGVLDGDDLAQRPARYDEAACVLGQVSREPAQLAREFHGERQTPVGGVEALFAGPFLAHRPRPPRDHGEQPPDHVLAQAHRLAHVAQRAPCAVGDDRRGQPGPVAPVLAVDVLDDLFAALVLEVDIDVGHLVALGGDEALEEQIDLRGIDRGDAETVAHRGVGGGTAALAEDAQFAGLAHDVLDGQEVGLVFELGDQRQFVFDCRTDLGRNAVRVAPGGARPSEFGQRFAWRAAVAGDLVGVFVAEFGEGEAAAVGDLDGVGEGLGVVAEKAGEFGGGLEVPFGVGLEAPARVVDGAVLADAGEHVVEAAARGIVLVDVAGGDEGDAVRVGEGGETGKAAVVVAAVAVGGGEVERGGEVVTVPGEVVGEVVAGRDGGDGDEEVAGRVGGRGDIVPCEHAFALGRASASRGDEAGERAVAVPGGGEAEQAGAVLQVEPGARDEVEAGALGGLVGADDPGQRVAVGQGEGAVAEFGRAFDHLLGVRGAPQEGKVAGDLEFGVGGGGPGAGGRAGRACRASFRGHGP